MIYAIKLVFSTIEKIQSIHNLKSIEIINEFLEYKRSNSSSKHHQNYTSRHHYFLLRDNNSFNMA